MQWRKDGFSINGVVLLTYPCESGLLPHKIHKGLVQIDCRSKYGKNKKSITRKHRRISSWPQGCQRIFKLDVKGINHKGND